MAKEQKERLEFFVIEEGYYSRISCRRTTEQGKLTTFTEAKRELLEIIRDNIKAWQGLGQDTRDMKKEEVIENMKARELLAEEAKERQRSN